MIDDFDRFAARDELLRGPPRKVRPGSLIATALLVVVVLIGILFIMLRFAHA